MTFTIGFILGACAMAAVLVIADNWQYRRGREIDALPAIRDLHNKLERLLSK